MVWAAFSAEGKSEIAMLTNGNSPDLNPIENFSSTLTANVYANSKQYYNFNELATTILAGWAGIGSETL